jgi:hypothetical protein
MTTAQTSGFGTLLGSVQIADIGQADNTALQLSLDYCAKYQVELSAVKTKLLAFSHTDSDYVKYVKLVSPVHIGDVKIPFVETSHNYIKELSTTADH